MCWLVPQVGYMPLYAFIRICVEERRHGRHLPAPSKNGSVKPVCFFGVGTAYFEMDDRTAIFIFNTHVMVRLGFYLVYDKLLIRTPAYQAFTVLGFSRRLTNNAQISETIAPHAAL